MGSCSRNLLANYNDDDDLVNFYGFLRGDFFGEDLFAFWGGFFAYFVFSFGSGDRNVIEFIS